MKNQIFSPHDTIVRVSPSGSYPRMIQLRDGSLLCAWDGMRTAKSRDCGITWSSPVKASHSRFDHLANANAALIQLENGDILLGHRAIGRTEAGLYTSLQVSISRDGGESWDFHSTIDEHTGDGGVWEPHFGFIDGVLTVFFADDCADRRGFTGFQNIEFLQYINGTWGNRTVVSDGNLHRSRDGMPTWTRLSDGSYFLVIEAWDTDGDGRMMIKSLTSPDGVHWSEPFPLYRSSGEGSKAAAPFVSELPDGRLFISFQTDEDSTKKGDGFSGMKTIVYDRVTGEIIPPEVPFETPDGCHSIWNGLGTAVSPDGTRYDFALTGTNAAEHGVYLRRAVW